MSRALWHPKMIKISNKINMISNGGFDNIHERLLNAL
jgi:hypothetical protein